MKTFFILCAVLAFAHCEKSLEEYLSEYGYYNPHSFAGQGVTDALKKYQNTFGLTVTGILDDATKDLMNKPRCGVADHNGGGYASARNGWQKSELTYYFHNYSPDLTQSQIRALTAKSFKLWSNVTNLKFTEVKGNGDIVIGFGVYNHGDDKRQCYAPFDGPGGTLAHAYFPPDGRLHFDEDENFTTMTPSGINFLWVATHEIGHILGLDHDTSNKNAVMFPYYRPYNPKGMKLHTNDVQRIQQIYGRKVNPDCKDERKQSFCSANISKCSGYADNWTAYMKKYCYRTCSYC